MAHRGRRSMASERNRGEADKSTNRAIGAAIVAGALAFSVSLYPLPDGPQLWDLLVPKHETSSKAAKVVEASFLNLELSVPNTLVVPDLMMLAALNNDPTAFASNGLLDLVMTYGLPDVVRAFELIQSYTFLTQSLPGISGGGGGGAAEASLDLWPALVLLLAYLQQNPSPLPTAGLLDVITTLLTAVAPSLDIPHAQAVPASASQSVAVDVVPTSAQVASALAPVDPTAAVSELTPTEYSVTQGVDTTIAPVTEAVIAPITETALAPTTEVSVSTTTEASASTQTDPPPSTLDEPSDTVTENSNSAAPEPDPSRSDSPSSPSGGATENSAPDSGTGSPSDAGGNGTSDNSGGDSPGGQ